jgi:hypothetical protein
MVFTVAVRPDFPIRWTRRAVLATGATGLAGAASGCTWLGSAPPEPPPPDPLEPLLDGTRELADRYARTLATHPDLAERLEPLRLSHLAHVAGLLTVIDRPELTSPSPHASPPPAGVSGIPSEAGEALTDLREREEAASEAAREACLRAPAERVGLLGSICAARATHAEVLA